MSMDMNPGTFLYTIQAGDSLAEIAEEHGTTVADIMAANPSIDFDNMYVGQDIVIPAQRPPFRRPEFRRPFFRYPFRYPRYPYPYPYVPPVTCPPGTRTYVIQPGDTLYSISARFGIPAGAIVAANPYINFNYPLPVGQVICLP